MSVRGRGRRFISEQSLTVKVVLGFVAIIIIDTLVIGAVLYYKSLTYVQQEQNLYGESLSRNVSAGVDTILDRMDRIAKILIGDPDIQSILATSQQPSYTSTQRLADTNTISKLLLGLTSFQDHFAIAFYDAGGQPLFREPQAFSAIAPNLFDNEWLLLNRWRVDNRELYFVPPYRAHATLVGGDQAFYVIRALTRIEDNSVIGYVTVVADRAALDAIVEENLPASKHVLVSVIDRQGRVAVSNVPSRMGLPYGRASRGYDSYRTLSDRSGLVTVIDLPPTYIASDMRSVQGFVALISLITMIGSLLLSLFLSARILKPLRSFTGSMSDIAEGNFDVELPENGLDADMVRLHHGFNRMVREIRRLIHDVYEQRLLAKSAQLEALQYQINPHFLYNTLQTMEAIGEVYDVREISVMSAALARLFRYNIQAGQTVTLQEEIEHVETYLEIERIRFGGSLELRNRVDAELAPCRVLKFILQPIVENSIVHGLVGARTSPYVIEIATERCGSTIALYVRDTGRGIDGEVAKHLEKAMSAPSSGDGEGKGAIGLANVHRRLAGYYGNGFGLEFLREADWGTVVRITMPIVQGGTKVEARLQSLDS